MDLRQGAVIPRSVFPVEFINSKKVVGIESTAIEIPQAQRTSCAPGAPIAIGKGVDFLKAVMKNYRTQYR